jgi:superfamily I DNA/RNA helicase
MEKNYPMIANSKLILGPPGCGKTYSLIQEVKNALAHGVSPSRIGVVSFTTKAIREFIDRACSEFNLTKDDFPHFRTLHATGFHGLGLDSSDVMGKQDYRALSDMLGVDFEGTDATSMDDGISIPTIGGSGAKYLQTIMRSKYREVSLSQEYNMQGDYSLHFEKLDQIDRTLVLYKSKFNKLDFSDMISQYIESVEAPYLDLLIVDEAQDLTPLQWTMVEKMSENAEEIIIAGDDDQAIHRWTGVNVQRFVDSSDRVKVLNKSYRLPRSVWSLAERISRRIPNRIPKEFYSREEEGRVDWVWRVSDLPLDQGSWTIMARTNSFVNDIAEELRSWGYFYSLKGRTSIKQEHIEVMTIWKDLQKGYALPLDTIKTFYKGVPKTKHNAVVQRGSIALLDMLAPDAEVNYQELVKDFGMLAPLDRDAKDIARLSEEEKLYIAAIERRGESIEGNPRIKLSTIHAMKGGEDDNVAVYLGSTQACMEGKNPEDEHRVFYVAVTRAKQNLYLIESDKKYRYIL